MDSKSVNELKDLIYQKLGLHFSKEKDYLLESKISRILQREKYDSFEDFFSSIKNGDKESLETLIKYVTTNHTFFFRESDHLKYLVDLIKEEHIQNPTIWCAASSTGEEVYSIIITLLENNITKFLIIASDINSKVLKQMHEGIYHESRFFETPGIIKQKYFKKTNEFHYQVRSDLRDYICIKKLNLIDNMQFVSRFDFIFCRNVMIYFDVETRNKVVHNLLSNLSTNGYLFLGHTETLINTKEKLSRKYNSVYKYLGT